MSIYNIYKQEIHITPYSETIMPKCSRVGCNKQATIESKILLVDGIVALVEACSKEHFDEIVESLTAFREETCREENTVLQ